MKLYDALVIANQIPASVCCSKEEEQALAKVIDAATKYYAGQIPDNLLTLEQLRQMDGKPVWATGKRSLGTDVNGWMLVDTTTSRPAALDFIGACNSDSYGKMWTAYAREPVSK